MFGKKKEVDRTFIFESMPVNKAILALAIPTIMNQLVNIFYNLADTFFVGKLNNPYMVSALSLSASVMLLLTACASLLVVGGCAVISKSLGEGNVKKAEDVAVHLPLMALCIGAVISILSLIFIDKFAWYAGATEYSFEYTKEYLKWVIGFNAIPNLLGATLGAGLRGRGYSKYEMFGLSFGNILNIILDPIFIFVFKMGVKGAAVATFISSCCAAVLFMIIANRMQKKEHLYTPYKEFRFQMDIVKEVVAIGFPAWLHQFLTSIVNTRFLNLVKTYSDAAVAAVGIGRKLEHFFGQAVIGLYQGCIPLISYNYGSRNYNRLNEVRKKSLSMGLIFGAFAMLLLVPFAKQFTEIFIRDEQTVAFGIIFVRIYAAFPFLMAVNNNCRTVYQAIGKKKLSVAISIFRNVVLFFPLIYVMNHFFGVVGLVSTNLVSDVLIDIYALIAMKREMKRIKAEFEKPGISAENA